MSHCSDDTIQLADGKHAAARERVAAGLDGDSTLDSGRPANTPLDLTIVAPATGEPPGGLSGHTSLGASFIEMFNLPRTLRRPGAGSDLLLRAEAGARRRGGDRAVRYAIWFQAPRFYGKHGYRVFGEVPSQPAGTIRDFMTKALSRAV